MIKMENIGEQDFGDFVPESLFEAIDQLNNGGKSCPNTTSYVHFLDEFMDYELDLSSENCTMTSFLELEQEIKEAPVISEPLIRPSVIVRASASAKPTVQPTLTDIMQTCGIEYDLPKEYNVSSPSSIHSDVQLEQNKELIEELEEFFIQTEGKPTVVEEPVMLSIPDLNGSMSNNLVTADGQNVIIIIGPESPAESLSSSVPEVDSDPEWSPSPAPLSPEQTNLLASKPLQTKPRKKYARSKPPSPPAASPYPADRKERKKAQNRTAAFRYREKKKTEQELAEEELEALEDKNIRLYEKLNEMETEFKYLKKLMVEAGLGKYTAAVQF